MKKVTVKCPTRVDLAGGTLDLWPISSFLQGAKTLNMAIDIYTSCTVEESLESGIRVVAPGIGMDKKIKDLDAYLNDDNNKSDFIYPHLKYFRPKNITVSFFSDSPIGGGLGGSSSLTISVMNALSTYMGYEPMDVNPMVHLAHNIEAFLLNTPTGTQDYYPPILGGALVLEHAWDQCHYKKIDFAFEKLQENFLLVYTGKPHHSGMNNWTVLKALIDGDTTTKRHLNDLVHITDDLLSAIEEKNWQDLAKIFKREYQTRSQLSSSFTNESIQDLEKIALDKGAEAVKICGAGGGGCVFLWADPDKHTQIRKSLLSAKYQVLDAKPTKEGMKVEVS